MRMELVIGAAAAGLLAACSTTEAVVETAESPRRCAPMQASADFSCWWSADDAPLSHCVLRAETEPVCSLGVKGGAYLTRGAMLDMEEARAPEGSWVVIKIFEDDHGRVGTRSTRQDDSSVLTHHWESSTPTGSTKPVKWPRFPEGLEFGPEQQRQSPAGAK